MATDKGQQEDFNELADEAEELDGYFSDTPLNPKPDYPPFDESFSNVIVLMNVPKVKQDTVKRLRERIVSTLGELGLTLASDPTTGFDGVYLPTSEKTKGTFGLAFVEVATAEDKKKLLKTEMIPLRKGSFATPISLDRVEKMRDEPGEFQEPKAQPLVPKPNTISWLEDANQRDSFVIREGQETVVYWNDGKNDPVVDYDGSREKEAGVAWCEYYCHWSPKGSYLATIVKSKGVVLWSGERYIKTARLRAPDVDYILFSPQEKYLLTSNNNMNDPNAIKIFDVSTGQMMRTFKLYPKGFISDEDREEGNIPPPPLFQWSFDDAYIAQMRRDQITVYDTKTWTMLDSRSFDTPGVQEFQWSPAANILSYWAPEVRNSPAHVDLIEIPSRKKLRQKNLFNVTKCSMVWQVPNGDYLGVKVTRHTKSKKTFYNNIELFRLNEPGVPVEMLDMKDAVMSLTFEPNGSRFAMIHAENPDSTKVNVSFYNMRKKVDNSVLKAKAGGGGKKKGGGAGGGVTMVPELNLIETLPGKQCNCLFWSPAGNTIIMASLGESSSGTLEFYDTDQKSLVIKEHYRCNEVKWDPSGRTVATLVSQPIGGGHFKFAMDNGYILWTFQGKQLYQQSYETFYHLEWRPREKILSKTQINKVRKKLKSYEKQFDAQDKERQRALKLEETKGKRAERFKYRDLVSRLRSIRARQKEERMALLDGYDSEDEANYVMKDYSVETILSSKEETVG